MNFRLKVAAIAAVVLAASLFAEVEGATDMPTLNWIGREKAAKATTSS